MGEATMKKMVYTNKIDDEIIFHENNMLALYLEKNNLDYSDYDMKSAKDVKDINYYIVI